MENSHFSVTLSEFEQQPVQDVSEALSCTAVHSCLKWAEHVSSLLFSSGAEGDNACDSIWLSGAISSLGVLLSRSAACERYGAVFAL